ncbi:SDR family oxidoreductase [Pseudomonas sp. PDM19]|uniref:SDR family oxidoreductase n=1 Tax=Pseudomonas sp. PDM19 TaxID=2769272 RepID=UPI00178571BB|nr:SDR family oxidoreductase [Pseudomonas sp. PDM19]MBD9629987.1 SDR family oxidoreductase [Pseudomonas sp. PDM19]
MSMKFSGKVALVTGAAGGIGRATALAFAGSGLNVVVSDLDRQGGEETVLRIREAGGEACFISCDVAQEEQVRALLGGCVAAYGRLDYAVNNAGIEGRKARVAECDATHYQTIMGVNVAGVLLCMKHQLPLLLAQGGGAIVNTASIAGLIGAARMSIYSASKHAVIGLTRSTALEYGRRNIRVNAVCPGMIDTDMLDRILASESAHRDQALAAHPMGRAGRPEEIAEAILFLCSDNASYINGHALTVDGGSTAQ